MKLFVLIPSSILASLAAIFLNRGLAAFPEASQVQVASLAWQDVWGAENGPQK